MTIKYFETACIMCPTLSLSADIKYISYFILYIGHFNNIKFNEFLATGEEPK